MFKQEMINDTYRIFFCDVLVVPRSNLVENTAEPYRIVEESMHHHEKL